MKYETTRAAFLVFFFATKDIVGERFNNKRNKFFYLPIIPSKKKKGG